MMRDFELASGDICGDPTGLRVRIEDVDILRLRPFLGHSKKRSGIGS
jgi:hypothetical protein